MRGEGFKRRIDSNMLLKTNESEKQYYRQKNLHLQFPAEQLHDNMHGDGFFSKLKSFMKKGSIVANRASDLYTGELGTAIRNAIPSSDADARPGFVGEKHAILQLSNGKRGVANFAGPGTQIQKRLRRQDPTRTEVDKISKAHDIRYALANDVGDIRKADRIMTRQLDRAQKRGLDTRGNILMARAINAKIIGEDLGLIKKDAFADFDTKVSSADRALYNKHLQPLEQQGYGLSAKDKLKLRYIRAASNRGKKSKRGKTKGKGVRLAGNGSGKLINFVATTVIPSLTSNLGLDRHALSSNTIIKALTMAMQNLKANTLNAVVNNMAKVILPIVTHLKLRQLGLKVKVNQALQGKKTKLLKGLKSGLTRMLKQYLKNGMSGTGLRLAGGSFWSGFKRGFSAVFKPAAKVFLAPLAAATGQPVASTILDAVADAL